MFHFTFEAAVLVSNLRAALRFASTDETREHLSAIRIESTGGAVRFIATDGHRLWVNAARPGAFSEEGVALVSRGDAEKIVKRANVKKGALSIRVQVDKGRAVAIQGGEDLLAFKLCEARFPPYAQVIGAPNLEGSKRAIQTVDGGYLADACAAFGDIAKGSGSNRGASATIVFAEKELDPIHLTSTQAPDALALIMPIRGTASEADRLATRYAEYAAAAAKVA